jgi:AraC-like DNA-binding protein
VEAAKELLLERLEQPLSLGGLAGELYASPYHLTRVFREHTGRTLTAYLHDLRLRAAVERLGEESLSRIAADLGYAARRTLRIASAPPSALRPRKCAISWKRRRAAGRRTAA